MRSVRLHAPGDLRLHDEDQPSPTQGESLLRVTSVGVCGSDLHWFHEAGIGDAQLVRPLVLGHEFAAQIESSGQRVAVDPAVPCGECEFCLQGNPNLCPAVRFAGHGEIDGALRQYLAWPNACLHPLPDALSDAEGVMLEPLGVALHATDLAHLKPGMSVGVFGCGPIGLLILQLALRCGAVEIIATDRIAHRLEVARALGATRVCLVGEDGFLPELSKLIGGRGVDVAFEAAGENAAVETAIQAACPGGRVVLVGIPAVDRTWFTASVARRKGLTILLCRRMKNTYPRAIALVERKRIDLRSLVTHHFLLEEAPQAFLAAQQRQGIKIVIDIA
jgi:L-iditol 2-dehydrogenase